MARQHIPAHLRRLVAQRAGHRCEYCLLPADWVTVPHHVDHVIPLKHGGSSFDDNFASACFECNLNKGTDIAAFDPTAVVLSCVCHRLSIADWQWKRLNRV